MGIDQLLWVRHIQHSAALFRHKRWDLVKIHLVALGARLSHPICPGYSGLSAGSGRALLAIRLILTKSLGSLYSTVQVYSVTARGFDQDSSLCFKAYGLVWWHGVKCILANIVKSKTWTMRSGASGAVAAHGRGSRGPLKGPWWGPGATPWWGSRGQSPPKL